MAGSVLIILVGAAMIVLLIVGFAAAVIVPAAVVLAAAIFIVPWVFGLMRRGETGGGDVPTTEEASYDPRVDPSQR